MALYEYICENDNCVSKETVVERFKRINDKEPEVCEDCGEPLKRVPSVTGGFRMHSIRKC